MFLFGHAGLTWGGVLAAEEVSRRLPGLGRRTRIDYRFVILGSMLPDIIDKPLGIYILGEGLSNGRIFAHSLLSVLLLLLVSLVARAGLRPALAFTALGAGVHLLQDRMWEEPHTLLWPLLGWRFERVDVSGWSGHMLEQLFWDPYTYVSEAAGATLVVIFLAVLIRRGGLHDFILAGRMPAPACGLAAGQERPRELQRGERPAER
ncbi:MAG: metal-dependent hydrolase [Dehalococcoidia bacterium]|nr:metal-dependent hydrolase [Dehalococcoidia bacterium]